MDFSYNTNGFAHHRLEDALTIIAELGYRGVALTPDVHHLDPYSRRFQEELANVRQLIDRLGLKVVIETGSRFLLDARKKHQPTLISASPTGRQQRLEFLKLCVEMAVALRCDLVSFWSGQADDNSDDVALMDRLADGCRRLADYAADRQVRLAFEPEPGMFIDSMDRFAELFSRVDHPQFGLTIDVGHLICLREEPMTPHFLHWAKRLWNIHLDDMRPDVHDHLPLGEGVVDFAECFAGLEVIGYGGMLSVELSRHSHNAVAVARDSLEFLSRYKGKATG